MKHLILALVFSLTAVSSLIACAPTSPENTSVYNRRDLPQPERPEIPTYNPVERDQTNWIPLDGGQSQLDFNPRVDILFVIDDSDSMKAAQANLVKNIGLFSAGIQKNKLIDYHIGVTSVWDSSDRYAQATKYKNGQIRGVVTKKNSDQLAALLNIGITPYSKGGPENEEVFSPIAEAIQTTNTGRGAPNEGFFREDSQLVVVILTDADDGSTSLSADDLTKSLFAFKGGNRKKVSVYAALVKASDKDEYKDWGLRVHPQYHPECFTGKKLNGTCAAGFAPTRLQDFVLKANVAHGTREQIQANHIMSLVQKDFGKDLAKIGNDIRVKTLEKTILLPERPRRAKDGSLMIRVQYGKQVIKADAKAGWIYNAEDNSIEVSGTVDYQYVEGARFSVSYVPVTLRK